jgi:hypothetical protein
MRTSHALVLGIALVVAACGGAPSPSPSVQRPSPTPTPDPHLTDPADVAVVYEAIQKAGMKLTVNNATGSTGGKEPRRRFAVDLGGWPLELLEYGSIAAREVDYGYPSGTPPDRGDPPYTLAGLNIVVSYGPGVGHDVPEVPDGRYQDLARKLALVLDTYLGPLSQRTVTDLRIPDPTPIPSPEASGSPAPSAQPSS